MQDHVLAIADTVFTLLSNAPAAHQVSWGGSRLGECWLGISTLYDYCHQNCLAKRPEQYKGIVVGGGCILVCSSQPQQRRSCQHWQLQCLYNLLAHALECRLPRVPVAVQVLLTCAYGCMRNCSHICNHPLIEAPSNPSCIQIRTTIVYHLT